jgi:hypothetical protein
MIPKQEAELLVATIFQCCKTVVPVEAALEALYVVEQHRYDRISKRGPKMNGALKSAA